MTSMGGSDGIGDINKMRADNSFDLLDEKMRRWVWLQGWQDLRPIQKNSILPIINADSDVIIGAPTAGGKTEAAYLPILSNLISQPVDSGYSVLNISPLKALINDQSMRLRQMTSDMGINVTPWHGDIAASTKRASLTHPSGILIITPESLESLFVNKPHALEKAFKNLRYVVVDELHAFMGSERGIQLMSLLSRIEHITGRQIPRIALSATFADYTQAVNYLRPQRSNYPISVPDPGNGGHDTLILIKEYTTYPNQDDETPIVEHNESPAEAPTKQEVEYTEIVAKDIYRNLRGSNNLVFANSRKEAEGMALKLRDLCEHQGVPNEFVVHHGSLSKAEREGVERMLKKGEHPTTAICTSTLELGVDIGSVKSIAQLVTANSVTALRQRLGRSGRRDTPSILRIYSLDETRDDYKYHLRTSLVQNIAVIQLLAQSRYEQVNMNVPHYSTLIQQILSITAQYGGFYPAEAWQHLCRDGVFNNVPPQEFLDILRALGDKNVLTQTSNGQIVIGNAGERIIKALDFYTAFVTLKDFNVVDLGTGKVIGSVQYMPYVGEYILLSARRWIVESIDERSGQIKVNAAHTTGKHMFEGLGQEIDGLITNEMRKIYESDIIYPYLDANTGAVKELQTARANYQSMGLQSNRVVACGDHRMLFTWGGMKLNRTLALMRKADGHPMPAYDAFAVADVPESYLKRLNEGKVDRIALVHDVPRNRKETEKFDYLLPDHLLDKKYAAAALDPIQ